MAISTPRATARARLVLVRLLVRALQHLNHPSRLADSPLCQLEGVRRQVSGLHGYRYPRAHLAARGLWYLAEVASDTHVWPLTELDGQTARPRPQRWVPPQRASRRGPVPRRERLHPDSPAPMAVSDWTSQVPPDGWQRYRLVEGSKGPLVAEFAVVRVVLVTDRLPGADGWLLVRRTLPEPDEEPADKYHLSNAPAATPRRTLVWVSGMRWPIDPTDQGDKERDRPYHNGYLLASGWIGNLYDVRSAALGATPARLEL
jgi:hypothetical protein